MQQLTMFQETREERLEKEVISLRDYIDKLRRSQFARLSELEKMYCEIKEQVNILSHQSKERVT
jgi:hypothetical protein